jgi:rare lipoprotein A
MVSVAEAKKKGSPRNYDNASWYGIGDGSRSKTASGRRFSPWAHIIAHRHLPFGTRVLLINTTNGRKSCGTVWDRGPFNKKTWDVTKKMAIELGFSGVATLRGIIGGC